VPAFELEVVRILRKPAVAKRVGLGKSTIDQMVRRGKFPRPIELTPSPIGWRGEDVDAWLRDRDVASVEITNGSDDRGGTGEKRERRIGKRLF
jgi:prophage regulatory protein